MSALTTAAPAFGHTKAGLAIHSWEATKPQALLCYIHGLQSHSGWLYETGPALAMQGVTVEALDRRGSGTRPGPRGHLPNVETVLDDYAEWLAECAQSTDLPVTVVGQSFGASILAALVATDRVPQGARLAMCAPALGQQRARLDSVRLQSVRSVTGMDRFPVLLHDENYTELPQFLAMMANDVLMARMVTASMRRVMVQIEDAYMSVGAGPWGDKGLTVALPDQDAVLDQPASLRVLDELAPQADLTRFATRSHYLEFTDRRHVYWHWLSSVVLAGSQ